MKTTCVGLALILAASATAVVAQSSGSQMRCDMYRAYICQATGCHDATTKAWSIIDWDHKDYALCDQSGCTHHRYQDWADGIYRSMSFPDTDLMVKLNITDLSVVETGTMLNASVISFGNCTGKSSGTR